MIWSKQVSRANTNVVGVPRIVENLAFFGRCPRLVTYRILSPGTLAGNRSDNNRQMHVAGNRSGHHFRELLCEGFGVLPLHRILSPGPRSI
jgi:hypothetical protein